MTSFSPPAQRQAGLLLMVMACAAFLSSCVSPSGDRALVNRVVVANYVKPEVARFSVGWTAFGNQGSEKETMPGLDARLKALVKEEARGRFKDAVFLESPPEPPAPRLTWVDPAETYWDFAKSLAATHHADAVMLVLPVGGVPYGVPNYMSAKGLAVYHTKTGGATPQAYMTVMVLNGKTGRRYGLGGVLPRALPLPLPWKPKLADYSAAEQKRMADTLAELFAIQLRKGIDSQGFPAR